MYHFINIFVNNTFIKILTLHKQVIQGILLLFLVFKSINTDNSKTLRVLKIVNSSAVGFGLGNLIIDCIKMPFIFDKMFSEEREDASASTEF